MLSFLRHNLIPRMTALLCGFALSSPALSSGQEPAAPVPLPPPGAVPSDASDEVIPNPSLPKGATEVTPQKPSPVEAPAEAKPREFSSLSPSGQFLVRGKDASMCSVLSSKADEIRKNLLDLLKIKGKWKYQIGISLVGSPGDPPPADPVRMGITLLGGIPSFTIYIHAGNRIEVETLNNAVATMLLYEITLRNIDVEALPEEIKLPPWLLYGIEQAMLWKTNQVNRDTYAGLFERGSIFHPEDILSQKNPKQDMDATTFAAYEASCGVLTLCLLSQKGGEEAMMRVLDKSIFGSDDPILLIKRNFPMLTLSPSSLHKWWTLQLSQMATPPMTESLTIPDSDKRLTEALMLIMYNPETRVSSSVNINDIDTALNVPNLREQLPGVSNNLVYLSNLCFPTYRPIIVQYARIVADIQMKKDTPENLKNRIAELVELRRLSLQAATRARDYLDWYEITTKSKQSNTFDSYLNMVKTLRDRDRQVDTPLSQYLKDIERLYMLPASPHAVPARKTAQP